MRAKGLAFCKESSRISAQADSSAAPFACSGEVAEQEDAAMYTGRYLRAADTPICPARRCFHRSGSTAGERDRQIYSAMGSRKIARAARSSGADEICTIKRFRAST